MVLLEAHMDVIGTIEAKKHRSMRGQILVFEQVLLFLMGVLIFIICVASFNMYQSYFTEASNKDQLQQVSGQIAYAIVKASNGWSNTESRLYVNIPKYIGGQPYKIKLTSNGLNVTMLPSMESRFTGLYGLNLTLTMQDSEVSSASGSIVLYKNGNKIILT